MADCGARLSKTMDGKGFGKGLMKSDMCASFWSDVGVLPNCDINKSNPNLMKAIDNIFKSRFREWKFDNQRAAKLQREPEVPAKE
ncbi:hypothetical protein C1H46_027908 [Malus baccata]|uniref:Uncharacterized protein n=1 Tax=Malus baccata TaxID=106549 RepID=A0A540LJ60_MALBA|nr:hypothetical protein C1H46_027908 [Malus baccata]